MMQQSTGSRSSSSSSLIFSLATTSTSSSLRRNPPPPPPPHPCRISTKVRRRYDLFVISSSSSSSSSSTPQPPLPPLRRKPVLKQTIEENDDVAKTPPKEKPKFQKTYFTRKSRSRQLKYDRDKERLRTFNKRINARAEFSQMPPGMATQFLNDVKGSGLLPDAVIYNTLISCCYRWSNFDEGLEIYNDMLASTESDPTCVPNLHTYNIMITLYGQCGMTGEAEKMLKELRPKRIIPDVVTYNCLIDAFAKEGNVEKVKVICEEMARVGIVKDEKTYGTIIKMYRNCGQHDMALQTYNDMVASNCKPDL